MIKSLFPNEDLKNGREKTGGPFYDTLKDIYFAERQILKKLPKMAKAAHSEYLKKAFLAHREKCGGADRALFSKQLRKARGKVLDSACPQARRQPT
jgi:ferritin-like metal-binding protein YciE